MRIAGGAGPGRGAQLRAEKTAASSSFAISQFLRAKSHSGPACRARASREAGAMRRPPLVLLLSCLCLMAGRAEPIAPRSGPAGTTMFALMAPEATGVVTENRYADPRIWMERYHEFAIGAIGTGVAIGDYDSDGRPDIFVVSKTETCRLFRNLGDWKFEDVTAKSGVEDVGEAARIWKQGATFTDVNNDGLLDLYLCRFNAANLLYVNQGNGTFKEEAVMRGLAINDASIMGAFCDYD